MAYRLQNIILASMGVASLLLFTACSGAAPTSAGPRQSKSTAQTEDTNVNEVVDGQESGGPVVETYEGLPFDHWPTCSAYNRLESVDVAIQLIGDALGNPDITEDEGWETMAGLQDTCATVYTADPSILRVLQDWQPDTPLSTVAWTVTTGPGNWGGKNFPAEVHGYRLVSEAEYAEFRGMNPGGVVCTFLGESLESFGTTTSGSERVEHPVIRAYYSSSPKSIAAEGCDSTGDMIAVTYSGTENIGSLTSVPVDARGNHCEVFASNYCGAVVDGGSWTAADFSGRVPLEDVSDFLSTVMKEN